MASNQSGLVGPTRFAAVTLDATPANSTEIVCPPWARQVTLAFKTTGGAADDSGKVSNDGTDGAAIDADHFPIASGGAFSFTVKSGDQVGGSETPSIFVTAATASAVCYVVFEEARP